MYSETKLFQVDATCHKTLFYAKNVPNNKKTVKK